MMMFIAQQNSCACAWPRSLTHVKSWKERDLQDGHEICYPKEVSEYDWLWWVCSNTT